jgi:hypothetical protein
VPLQLQRSPLSPSLLPLPHCNRSPPLPLPHCHCSCCSYPNALDRPVSAIRWRLPTHVWSVGPTAGVPRRATNSTQTLIALTKWSIKLQIMPHGHLLGARHTFTGSVWYGRVFLLPSRLLSWDQFWATLI